jgi:hypothetical protein
MRSLLAVIAIAFVTALAVPTDASAHRVVVRPRVWTAPVAVRVGPVWIGPRVRIAVPVRTVWRGPRRVVVVRD